MSLTHTLALIKKNSARSKPQKETIKTSKVDKEKESNYEQFLKVTDSITMAGRNKN